MNIRSIAARLRAWFVSPLVQGLMQSLKEDPDTWLVREYDREFAREGRMDRPFHIATHSSGRFSLVQTAVGVVIAGESGLALYSPGFIENWLLWAGIQQVVYLQERRKSLLNAIEGKK